MEKNKNTNPSKDTTYNSDVTKHDLEILAQDHIHGDGGDDQQLRERARNIDFSGSKLDVPGRTKDEKNTTDLKDEENKLYSQGSDSNENLERDDASKG